MFTERRGFKGLSCGAVCVLAMGMAMGGWARAQQPPAPTMTVTSRLVVLDVVVVDRSGKPVTNLTRSQFSIYEDRVLQRIKDFDPPSAHRMPEGTEDVVHSSADLPKIGQAPVDVLVFDELDTPFLQLAYARQMMERYLKAQPAVLPVPTLFLAAGATRIAVLHDYTQSRAELLASVQKHTADLDFTQVMNSLNGGQSGADYGMVKTLGALSQIAESLRGVPGRKNVIWVGTGYNKASDLTSLSQSDHDRVMAAIEQVTDKMLAARVTLYSIDPSGPSFVDPGTEDTQDPNQVSSPGQAPASFGDNMGFNSFVSETGGRVIGGRNDLDAQVAQASLEGTEYYTLSYVPTSATDAAQPYRKIRVTVNDPSLRVITRAGYFSTEAPVEQVALAKKAKQPRDVRFDLLNAARTTLPYTGLHMEAKRTKNGYALLVNGNDLRFAERPDGTRVAEVTVLAVCYNSRGKETGQQAAELREMLKATDVIGPQSEVNFTFPMVVPPYTSRVRFVMRDAATGTLGSANTTR